MTSPQVPSDSRIEFRETISTDRDQIDRVLEVCMDGLATCGHDETAVFAIRLAMEESLANAMNHGNGGDPTKSITVEFELAPGFFRASVEDQGPGFNPDSVTDPTADENLTIASGRGLALMKAFMSEIRVVPPGNRIEMSYCPADDD